MADEVHHRHHFLIVAYGVQSHVNPARALAHRLTRLGLGGVDASIRATLCLSVSTHRRMFPSSDGADQEATDGVVYYVPYSDGLDDGFWPMNAEERARSCRAGGESISAVIDSLAARGRPVTCVMCTMAQPSVLDVASERGVPFAVVWIQPAHVLAACFHYFHGYGERIAFLAATDPAREVSLPGLTQPLRVRDFPSFLVDATGSELNKGITDAFRELLKYLDQRRSKFLVNTFDELEPEALAEMKRHLDVSAVGPMVGTTSSTEARRLHLFDHDDVDRKMYMDWLDAQPETSSVVYVSFGSISKYKKQQMEEIVQGLKQCGRPYLLVVRKDGLEDDDDDDDGVIRSEVLETDQVPSQGMVVAWCDQFEVLSHPAVGCFVTHCGWNSTLEAVVSGVPVVAVPNMFDQPTSAYLAEEEWQIGTRVKRNSEGVLTGTELARCIELIMGEEGAKARVIRERAKALKEIAQDVAVAGGRAERNLLEFVKTI